MRTASLPVSFLFLALLSGCAGKGAGGGACANVTCPAGQGCDTQTGTCVPLQAVDACRLTCSGGTPVCDDVSRTCKVCTEGAGCGGATPVCNTATLLGACVQCTDSTHCGPGQRCNVGTFSCVPVVDGGSPAPGDAGVTPPDAGLPEACNPACGGLTPRCEPISGLCVACMDDADCGTGGQCDTSLFACTQGQCITPPAPPQVSCTPTCPEGFACQNGTCALRGGSGEVQVTLRWDTDTDLDLHLLEPTANGSCEISYSDPNRPGQPSQCGAVGSLDLDSNACCAIDGVNVENIIYPPGPVPSGTYTVQVENFDACSVAGVLPFEVTVRANGQVQVLCGGFPNASGGANKTVLTFSVP